MQTATRKNEFAILCEMVLGRRLVKDGPSLPAPRPPDGLGRIVERVASAWQASRIRDRDKNQTQI
jgi:hypothetical protein